MASTGGTLQFSQIPVRTCHSPPEFGKQTGLEIRRDRMLESFRFVVNLVPFHPKNFSEHALDEMVANCQFAGNSFSGCGQANAPVIVHPYQAIFL